MLIVCFSPFDNPIFLGIFNEEMKLRIHRSAYKQNKGWKSGLNA